MSSKDAENPDPLIDLLEEEPPRPLDEEPEAEMDEPLTSVVVVVVVVVVYVVST